MKNTAKDARLFLWTGLFLVGCLITANTSFAADVQKPLAAQTQALQQPDQAPSADVPGWYALPKAISDNNIEEVKRLLQAGGNPNQINQDGETMLMRAINVKKPNVEMVDLLLQAGADPNRTDAYSTSSLMYAVTKEKIDPQIILLLLQADANPNLTDGPL